MAQAAKGGRTLRVDLALNTTQALIMYLVQVEKTSKNRGIRKQLVLPTQSLLILFITW